MIALIDRLLELYWDQSMERGPNLAGFVRRAAAGEFGEVTPDQITQFLRSIEEITIENVMTKSKEGGYWAQMADEVIERTRSEIQELIAAYGRGQADDGKDRGN